VLWLSRIIPRCRSCATGQYFAGLLEYSGFQLELSRNLLFLRGTTMNEVYQKLIDRTRAPLDFEAGQDHFRLLASPAQDSKAGTPD
jgi:hypothetical protein